MTASAPRSAVTATRPRPYPRLDQVPREPGGGVQLAVAQALPAVSDGDRLRVGALERGNRSLTARGACV